MLGFLDFEQVPVSADHTVLYAEVESQALATAGGEFVAPHRAGEHEFFVLVVDNPYLDQAEDFTAADPLWADTYTSDRVLIRVE